MKKCPQTPLVVFLPSENVAVRIERERIFLECRPARNFFQWLPCRRPAPIGQRQVRFARTACLAVEVYHQRIVRSFPRRIDNGIERYAGIVLFDRIPRNGDAELHINNVGLDLHRELI